MAGHSPLTLVTPHKKLATSRLFAILNIAICMPVCWLAGNTHKLAHHNWCVWSIGRVFDILNTALNNILDDITLIYEKSTMMFTIFRIKRQNLLSSHKQRPFL